MLKTIGFTMCSLKSIEKALVLQCFRSKRLKNHWFYCKIIVRMQTSEKTIGFTEKKIKKSKHHYKTNGFLKKRVVKPISSHGFGPWVSNTRLDEL